VVVDVVASGVIVDVVVSGVVVVVSAVDVVVVSVVVVTATVVVSSEVVVGSATNGVVVIRSDVVVSPLCTGATVSMGASVVAGSEKTEPKRDSVSSGKAASPFGLVRSWSACSGLAVAAVSGSGSEYRELRVVSVCLCAVSAAVSTAVSAAVSTAVSASSVVSVCVFGAAVLEGESLLVGEVSSSISFVSANLMTWGRFDESVSAVIYRQNLGKCKFAKVIFEARKRR
jgi:hypothetical protein